MIVKKYTALFVCVLIFLLGFSQDPQYKIDSLQRIVGDSKSHDTTRLNARFEIADEYFLSDPDTAFILLTDLEKNIREKLNVVKKEEVIRKLKKTLANCINSQGLIHKQRGDAYTALRCYNECVSIFKSIDDESGVADMYHMIGTLYYRQGDVPRGLEYLNKSLKVAEKNNDKRAMAYNLLNLGTIYFQQKNVKEALEYLNRCMKLYEETGDKRGMALVLNNIGGIHYNAGDTLAALYHYDKSLKIVEEMNDQWLVSSNLNNIGVAYYNWKKYDKALEYYQKSLSIREKLNDKQGIAGSCNNIGSVYIKTGNLILAEQYCKRGLDVANETGFPEYIRRNAISLSEIYEAKGDFKNAFKMYRLYIEMSDKVTNEENTRKSTQMKMQYEFNKEREKDSLENLKQKELDKAEIKSRDSELKAKRQQQYALYGGLFLLVLFSIFMYNRFRVAREQKKIIGEQKKEVELQKHMVDEKQKEIIDSINYAQRLQQAILAPESEIKSVFPDSFLLYKPKDIVAGDFYFFEITDSHIFYAAADCTGHGVPGALVSIVCSNALTRSVKEFGLTDPGKILDKTRELILETFKKSGQDVKDGMDISLVSIAYDMKNGNEREIKSIAWSGANNPLWYIENGEMKEIKADKQPIGKSDQPKPFTTHILPQTLSALFLFTDGYADQFGGVKGKKFKYSSLQNLLLENASEKPELIKQKLETVFHGWKGDLEQVDDVCIIGIRV
jgi:tetratricopeptide (TPR) repeat protein